MRPGRPLNSDRQLIYDYIYLNNRNLTPALRAWIREADQTIRQNNELYGVEVEKEQPWLIKLWRSFSALFTASSPSSS